MQSNKFYLLLLFTLLLSGCNLPDPTIFTPTFTATYQNTPTPTIEATITPTIALTSTSTSILPVTETLTPIPPKPSTFTEDFSSIILSTLESKFKINCNTNYRYTDEPGVYTIKVDQEEPAFGYCLLEPYTTELDQVENVSIRVKYASGEGETYVGFKSNCGDIEKGFWIDDEFFIFTSNNKYIFSAPLPETQKGFYEIYVTWGNQIQIYVNGQEIADSGVPTIFECSSYPTDIAIGAWLNGGDSIIANIDSIDFNLK